METDVLERIANELHAINLSINVLGDMLYNKLGGDEMNNLNVTVFVDEDEDEDEEETPKEPTKIEVKEA